MGLFSHAYHVSRSLPSLSQWLGVLYCCYHLAFICRVLSQICSRRITLSHALIELLGHLVCFFEIFRFSTYNTNHMYWLLTVVVIAVGCSVRHSVQNHQLLHRRLLRIIDSRRCKTCSIGQCVGLFIPRSSVETQNFETPRTQIYLDLSRHYIDPQARALNHCLKSWKQYSSIQLVDHISSWFDLLSSRHEYRDAPRLRCASTFSHWSPQWASLLKSPALYILKLSHTRLLHVSDFGRCAPASPIPPLGDETSHSIPMYREYYVSCLCSLVMLPSAEALQVCACSALSVSASNFCRRRLTNRRGGLV